MFYSFLRTYYKFKPKFLGFVYRLFFSNTNLVIGKNFVCDTFPKITLDKGCKLIIGDNVIFRRNVEIRVHGESLQFIGDGCRIDRGVRILSANKAEIRFEKGVRIGLYSVLNGGDSITIGEKSLVSGFVYLQTSMHNYQGVQNVQSQGYSHSPIVLGNDVWLGTHSVIFPGTVLGDKCVVGSSSVVNKSFVEKSIIVGAPAKLIKKRN